MPANTDYDAFLEAMLTVAEQGRDVDGELSAETRGTIGRIADMARGRNAPEGGSAEKKDWRLTHARIMDRMTRKSWLPGGWTRKSDAPDADTDFGGGKEDTSLGDFDQRAELMADIIGGLLGEKALAAFAPSAPDGPGKSEKSYSAVPDLWDWRTTKEWRSIDHPRGSNGRFIPKASPEAVSAARQQIHKLRALKPTPESTQKLIERLSILTVAQLRHLKKQYGLQANGRLKMDLIAKIAERLPGAHERMQEQLGKAAEALGLSKDATMANVVDKIMRDGGYPDKLMTQEQLRSRLSELGISVPFQYGEAANERYGLLAGKRKEGDNGKLLEGTGGEGAAGGVSTGQPVGNGPGEPAAPGQPGTGQGTGSGTEGLPASADVGGNAAVREANGRGNGAGAGTGAGAGGPVGAESGRDAGAVGSAGGGGGHHGGGGASAAEAVKNQPPTAHTPTDLSAGNFRYSDTDFLKAGLKAKYAHNLEAVRTYKAILAEGRDTATPAEQEILAKYVGWGQFPGVFNEYGVGWEESQKWKKEREQLRALLSDEEWEAARRSTLNAHYTHPEVVQAHWKMAEKLGYKGGRFLETSAGIGYYLGLMPPGMAGATHSTAVELDQLTGGMLRLLYPATNVQVKGFQAQEISPDNFHDLVASNVPFGDYKVHDPRYNKHQANIHDYFFLKSADVARPGGLVMHITSTGTMDKGNPKIRKALAEKLELVSAVRFPGGAHKENAGTEVVTDMLIFRKKDPNMPAVTDETPGEAEPKEPGFTGVTVDALGRIYHWRDGKRVPAPDWTETTTVPDPAGGDPIPVNRYFADNPQQILGTLDRTGTMYQENSVNVSKTDDYEQRLQAAIDRLPEGVMRYSAAPAERFAPEVQPVSGQTREGGYNIKEGKLYVRQNNAMVEQGEVSPKELARIEGHLKVRDTVRDLLNAQLKGEDSTQARARLNEIYDAFVAEHGYLNDKANKKAFLTDPDSPVLLALEKYDAENGTAEKAEIFHNDTIRPHEPVTAVGSVSEGLGVTLNEKGRLDVAHIAKLTGLDEETVGRELTAKGLAFHDPSEGWKPADQYLSGNVRRKLLIAKAAAASDPKYQPNVAALEKVQPVDLDHTEIEARLGASWIPPKDVAAFAAFLLNGSAEDFDVGYVSHKGEWMFDFSKAGKYLAGRQLAREVWSAGGKRFDTLFQAALDNKPVSVYVEDSDGSKHLDSKATDEANLKISEMKEAFRNWVWEDDERRERLHRFYNDNFNNIRDMEYDGSHLTMPGMNPSIKLRPHIKDFVWQVITTGKGLAAHEVGTGKAQPLDAKILTPTGWIRMGDVRVGDLVIAGDGTPTAVEAVFPQGEKEIFRVMFSDGSATECCEEHLWLTQTYRERSQAINASRFAKSEWNCDKPKVRSLAEIRTTLISKHLGAKNHSIPIVGAVQFSAREVPIDPYVLGVLIGDGSISHRSISFTSTDTEIVEQVRGAVPAGIMVRVKPSAKRCPTWALVRISQAGFGCDKQPNPVTAALESFGLLGRRSHDKFVPDDYKFNTPAVRLAMLQGLLDTDGYAAERDNSITFYTVSRQLADDVTFLVQSLGGVVRRSVKRKPRYRHKGEIRFGRDCYRLCLNLPCEIAPFRLPRKASKTKEKTRYRPARYIVSVEPVGKKPAQCIRVAHPTHLYVTDDFLVTHNTLSMICSAMELRRLGLAKKPCIAVKKANIEEITRTAINAYPGAKILSLADVTDAASRKRLISQIATGDYDMVIMTHDNLDMFGMTPATQAKYIQEELDELVAAKLAREDETKEGEGGYGRRKSKKQTDAVVKELEKAQAKLEERLKEALSAEKKDDALYFEESGIDQLLVDEFHRYKSLPVYTKQDRVKGIPTSRSDRATDMKMRARWMQEQNGGRGLVALTGTPVTNTMAELYTMQQYLQPEQLKERGIQAFDAWASTFGDITTSMEKTVSGEYKNVSRFNKFVNIPELMGIARQMMDVRRADDMRQEQHFGSEGEALDFAKGIFGAKPDEPQPTLEQLNRRGITVSKNDAGGFTVDAPIIFRPHRKDDVVVAPHTEAIADLMASLQKRAEEAKGQRPEKGADNMLNICTDGRKGSIDMRLLDANAEDDPQSKTNLAVQKVLELHRQKPDQAQLIFSDIGVHPTDQGFRLYDDIIKKLVAGGIPRNKIADFSKLEGKKKEDAQEKLRKGEMVIGIGGTEKLGTGVNVQDRLMALHHLDVPWVPAALEQRDGRAWRSGNQNKNIGIYRYVSEGSLDEMFWQVIGNKTNFIKQVMTPPNKGTGAPRVAREEDEALTPEQVKAAASGDPRILEKVNVDEDVRQLRAAHSAHERAQSKLKQSIKAREGQIPHLERRIEGMRNDARTLESNPDFSLTIDGHTYEDRKEAGEALNKKAEEVARDSEYYPELIGQYRGMDLYRRKDRFYLKGEGDEYPVGQSPGSLDAVARMQNRRIEDATRELADHRADIEKARKEIGKPFGKAQQLQDKVKRQQELERELAASNKKEGGAEVLEAGAESSPMKQYARDLYRQFKEHNDQSAANGAFQRLVKLHNLTDEQQDELKQEFRRLTTSAA